MGQDAGKAIESVCLNLGCGFVHKPGFINVDQFDNCKPDVRWDLNEFPYPWDDNSIDLIAMFHVLEHLDDWWGAFQECARILKVGAVLEIRVPDESSCSALTFRDHNHVFSRYSFHGISGHVGWGTNAWEVEEAGRVPLEMFDFKLTPHKKYYWMMRWCPRLLVFCADHLRNFIWEQRFYFRKVAKPEPVDPVIVRGPR